MATQVREIVSQQHWPKAKGEATLRTLDSIHSSHIQPSWLDSPRPVMNRLLLIDDDSDHAEQLGIILAQRRIAVTRVADIAEAIQKLRAGARAWEIVVLVFGDYSRPWFSVLHNLQEAAWHGALPEVPLFLCVSRRDLGIDFDLRIERMGARYVYEE